VAPLPTPYYDRDGITIYCGDALEILPLLAPVELIVTDPPYGVGYDYGEGHDDSPDAHWVWFDTALNVMRGASPQVVFTHRQEAIWHLPKPDHLVVWHKPFNLTYSIKGWQAKWEPIFVYGGVVTKMADGAKRPSHIDSWAYNTVPNDYGHPATKPVTLYREIISTFSGDVVDPFMGSGTTLRAAKDLGRRAIGIEIEERYCEIAVRRLSQEVLAL
jgi:DNA modification methylase